jgi:hypothetical protein
VICLLTVPVALMLRKNDPKAARKRRMIASQVEENL